MTQKYLLQIADLYGTNLKFDKYVVGSFSQFQNTITVGKFLKDHEMITTFFHELGHMICHVNGWYKKYHNLYKYLHRTCPITSAQAVRIEMFVDKLGKEECKLWFPDHKYIGYYKDTLSCRNFLKMYYSQGGIKLKG